ncbi:MAG: hypothetical protein ACK5XE_08295 [Burkholderiales bacterium]
MKFLYAQISMETGEIEVMFAHPEPLKWWADNMVSIGAIDETTLPEGTRPCAYAIARLEKHPLADSHPDAPRLRWKPDAADLPDVAWMPCSLPELAAHCEARGRDGLPDASKAVLRQMLAHREDVSLKTLHALGYTFDELKQHPRLLAKRQAIDAARIAEQTAAAEAEREAARQARIDRRLGKPSTGADE